MTEIVAAGRDPRPDPSSPLPPLRLEPVQRQFRQVAAVAPGRTALVHETATWTFGELESASARLGALLGARGVERGDVVAIVADRSPAFVCGMLGALEAGAAFAVIDDANPPARVAAYLTQARPRHVLLAGSAQRRAGSLPAGLDVTCLPDRPFEMAALVASYPAASSPDVSATDLAYLLFTSGTTGTPRCVAVGHAPLPHFVGWQRSEFALGDGDQFSLLSGLSHDPMLRDVFTPLSSGATLHLPPQRVMSDTGALFAWMRERRITVSHLTPWIGRQLLAAAEGQRLPDLRWLFWGGDVLPPALVTAFADVAPTARHVDFYGTTETPQAVGHHRVVDAARHERIPIGRGIDGVQLLVLDDAGELAPVGVAGELVVRSRYLARGYWPDLAATAGRFTANPRGRDPGDRLFRTGDRGRWLPDGAVELLGRIDDQVKVRGERVELGEVATTLRQVPAVRDVVVLGRPDASGELQLVAFATPVPGLGLATETLAASARRQLPRDACPAAYRILPELPLTPSGKVDRAALLALPLPDAAQRRETARTEKEQVLARLWGEVLGVPEVGRNESFYDLGGDSLTALRVMVRMSTLGLDEAVCRQILHGKTIAEIAAEGPREAGGAASPAPRHERHSPLLLNVVRGLMVALVVGAHWLDALLRRWPDLLPSTAFVPLLNGATPGFAIAFGMTLGFVHFPVYRQSPARARILLRRGALLVGAGMVLWAVDQAAFNAVGRGGLHPLASPLFYYVLALLTAPAWLRWLGSSRDVITRAAMLAVGFEAVHQGLRAWRWPKDSWVWGHWALGEYSYFNLAAGTMVGVVLGFMLRRRHGAATWYPAAGMALVVIGTLLSVEPDRVRLFEVTGDVEIWKWVLYSGLMLLCVRLTDVWLSAPRRPLAGLARVTGTIGQLAFPFFILDFASRDLSKLCDVAGVPQARLVVGALMFGAGAAYMVTRAHRLYYGRIDGVTGRAGDDVRVMLPEA